MKVPVGSAVRLALNVDEFVEKAKVGATLYRLEIEKNERHPKRRIEEWGSCSRERDKAFPSMGMYGRGFV